MGSSPCHITVSLDNREFPFIRLENMDPNLYTAAMKGKMELLTSILEVACPPDLTVCLTPQKNTVLHIAVEFGHQNIVENVIQLCPSLISQHNSKGDTPLHVAARAGHLDLTVLLTSAVNLNLTVGNPALEAVRRAGGMALRMSNSEGSNPIHEALKKSHEQVALHLLAFEGRHHELARDVNMAGESLLYLAAEAGLNEVVRIIIRGGGYSTEGPDGQNPLHIALIKGRLGVVEILLEERRNFVPQADCFGNTALHYASAISYRRQTDGIEILELLLGADQSLAYVPNRNGDYPLFIAIRKYFGLALCTILDHCPDSSELVNQKGQNALHLAVMEKNCWILRALLERGLEFEKLINEPDNDGNTPMHLATLTNDKRIARLLIDKGTIDLTLSNKQGLTAMDICGYTETEHPIRDVLRKSGAVPGRHRWQEQFRLSLPPPLGQEFKALGLETLPIVTSIVATVTFAAAFTMPGGYENDGPREGLPVFVRNKAVQAFVLSDVLAFCSSMAVLLIYFITGFVNVEDPLKIYRTLQTCYLLSGVAILATMTAFVTAVYVSTSKESSWLAVTSLVLGIGVPLSLAYIKQGC